MESFQNKEIIFYTLILNEKEIQKIQESPEILEDFLEDKVCSLLNLPRQSEYFSRFSTQDSKTYHCLLLDKGALKNYVQDAQTYLSHPCFLCAQFLRNLSEGESQAFLVLDSYQEWTLICFVESEIVFLQGVKDLKSVEEKLESLLLTYKNLQLTFWLTRDFPQKESLEILQAQFNAQILSHSLKEVERLDSFNFNPLEKSPPFSQQRIGKVLKFLALGVFFGIGIFLVLLVLIGLENREIQSLQSQISQQQAKIHHQNQNHTQSQKQAKILQEKLESLQSHYDKNAQFLQNTLPNSLQLIPFLDALNPLLEQRNVKIAYFGLEEKTLLNLLLRGENALQVLEDLERAKLGNVLNLKKYQDFYWVQIALRIPQ